MKLNAIKKRKYLLVYLFILLILITCLKLSRINNLTINETGSISSFSTNLSVSRLNRLIEILLRKESIYGSVLSRLRIVSFQDLIKSNLTSGNHMLNTSEVKMNFFIENNSLKLKQSYLDELAKPKSMVETEISIGKDIKPVVLIAGNAKYFKPLCEAIRNVQKHLKSPKIIIFDLGLTINNKKQVNLNFNNFFCIYHILTLKKI